MSSLAASVSLTQGLGYLTELHSPRHLWVDHGDDPSASASLGGDACVGGDVASLGGAACVGGGASYGVCQPLSPPPAACRTAPVTSVVAPLKMLFFLSSFVLSPVPDASSLLPISGYITCPVGASAQR